MRVRVAQMPTDLIVLRGKHRLWFNGAHSGSVERIDLQYSGERDDSL